MGARVSPGKDLSVLEGRCPEADSSGVGCLPLKFFAVRWFALVIPLQPHNARLEWAPAHSFSSLTNY